MKINVLVAEYASNHAPSLMQSSILALIKNVEL